MRSLENDGLVTRTVHATVPPQVEYTLTELGLTLRQPISALERWAVEHMDDVLAARRRKIEDRAPTGGQPADA